MKRIFNTLSQRHIQCLEFAVNICKIPPERVCNFISQKLYCNILNLLNTYHFNNMKYLTYSDNNVIKNVDDNDIDLVA